MVPALVVLALASAVPEVHTVDDTPGTGADFATIQAAIDAASDGDTILIAAGTYAGFVVDGKDLALTFDGAPVTVTTPSIVRNMPAEKQVLLRRLYLQTFDSVPLRVEQADGTVWIEECSLLSSHTSGTYHAGSPGLSVADALDVRVIRSLVQGEPGSPEKLLSIYAKPGGAGIAAISSALSVFDSNAIGGKGGNAWPFKGLLDAADAGAGIALDSSSLRAWGSTLQGGDGGNADYCECPGGKACGDAGEGGDGLAVTARSGRGRSSSSTSPWFPGRAEDRPIGSWTAVVTSLGEVRLLAPASLVVVDDGI